MICQCAGSSGVALALNGVIPRASVCSPAAVSLIRCLFLAPRLRSTGLPSAWRLRRSRFLSVSDCCCVWVLLSRRLSSVFQEVKDRSTFICPLCDKNCQTQHHLTMHIRQVQTKSPHFTHDASQKSFQTITDDEVWKKKVALLPSRYKENKRHVDLKMFQCN